MVSRPRQSAINLKADIHQRGLHVRFVPQAIALAWVLKRSPVMLPIPGTSKVVHLEENVAAVNIQLSDEEFDTLHREGSTEYRQYLNTVSHKLATLLSALQISQLADHN